MRWDTIVFGIASANVVAGLMVLLLATAEGNDLFVIVGGIVVLGGVSLMTGAISKLPSVGDESGH